MTEHHHFTSFADFWPYYVCEHSRPETRAMHFTGTLTIIPLLLGAIFISSWLIVLVPISAYGFAWASHLFLEKNRPATFSYPLWSLAGDLKMFWLMCRGKMQVEVMRCQQMREDI